jgi:hypothetical protein
MNVSLKLGKKRRACEELSEQVMHKPLPLNNIGVHSLIRARHISSSDQSKEK